MNMGRVVGNIVSTRKDETLIGTKLLITQPLDLWLRPNGSARVMVDTVGAGVGELVLYVSGAASRNAAKREKSAIDMAIVGIIDSVDVNLDGLDANVCAKGGEEHFE